MSQDPTYVFVHGTHANAYYWSWFCQELALRGRRALAVDLPGHGVDAVLPDAYQRQDLAALPAEPSPLAKLTAEDYADHVEEVVRRARRNGPVVLVGHSQGGVTLSLVGNRVPDLIHRLVYISAFCCVDRPSMAAYLQEPPLLTGELARITQLSLESSPEGVARVNWRSADPAHEAAFRAANAHTWTPAQSRAMHQMLQPDEPGSITTADARGHAETWGRIPRTYVRLTQDRLLPPELQDQWIAEADRLTPDNPFDVHSIASPHFLARDPELVDVLDRLGG
ncbi:alpha/beta hydrolase [Streptomonospora sp. S1-112]|uniref:Alpha/beta hydrolase n=1 Tax=Streptomonospora mangrovi TaxID=2883123 RepID=A0A9X3NZ09_9ACTN|nr:alpha/beta hydrolase [Streptomonospora mangrovi]MDA0567021.1 alpha/beta hydrolase [Streptomonospora mangrovi]